MRLKPNNKPFRLTLGERGEALAWNHLKQNGFEILEKNFNCPLGEIDIIACKDGRFHFVEVKTRTDRSLGYPEEAVDGRKQRKITQIAAFYLKANGREEARISFDVVAIDWPTGKKPVLRMIDNAFIGEDPDPQS